MFGNLGNIANIIGTIISAAAVGKSLVSKEKKVKPIKMPELKAPAQMPTMDDAAIRRARLDAIRRRQAASGRRSTMLSSDETLG